jgi:two-component system, response regulator RpfG
VSISILNLGCPEEDVLLFREVLANDTEIPLVHTIVDHAQAHIWASLHRPDAAIVDFRRPSAETVTFVRRFRQDSTCDDIPLLAVVDEYRRDDRADVLLAGATEIIAAPIDPYECRARLVTLLTLSAQQRMLRAYHRRKQAAGDSPEYVLAPERDVLIRLARAGEFRNGEMGAHLDRIGKTSRAIAARLKLSVSQCDIIEVAAPMHDIGKIGIPDSILLKPGPLTSEERKQMETHTLIGFDMLKNSNSPYLQCGADIALAHHEKYDGSGYPHGIGGEEIPLAARIVAVADVYDALRTRRPYKDHWTAEETLEYLETQKGTHFDPRCVDALLEELNQAAGF